jgi:DNA-binding NarL/FixJ family response regulator
MNKIRVLLVDDHPVVRRGLHSILSNMNDIQVIGEAENSAQALEYTRERHPDVIILDIRMPGSSGLQIIQALKQMHPTVKIVVLTSYDSDEHLFGALSSGAHGFVLKSVAHEEIAEVIRGVYRDERQLRPPKLVGRVLGEFETYAKEVTRHKAGLSDTQIQILRLIADGSTNREIAAKLHWSEITVKRKISEILTQLNVTTRTQAVSEAMKRGLI